MPIDYKSRLKKLRSLGLSPPVKSRVNFSTNEKRIISTLWGRTGELAEIADKPKASLKGDVFTATTRTLKTRGEIRKARDQGMTVYKNKLIIRHRVGQSVTVRRKRKGRGKTLEISTVGNGIRRTRIIDNKQSIIETLQKLVGGGSPVEGLVTVQIGKNSAFGFRAATYADLLAYISAWEPADEETVREDLIAEMSIVEVDEI